MSYFARFQSLILRILNSNRFFYVIVGLLGIQAMWIALTARYPQAFDENFHLGLIQLHAQQWLPFFNHQPDNSSVYGALVRDPSYLFHYLLSLPYRVLSVVTTSQTIIIIVLRFINIGCFVAGLFVYRRLLSELNISRRVSHVVLLFFVLLPVVPLLAGQINYDNLMLPLTGLLFLYTLRIVRRVRDSNQRLSLTLMLSWLLVGATGSVVKFTFTPLFAAAAILIGVVAFRRHRRTKQPIGSYLVIGNKVGFAILLLCSLIAIGLCVERYGVNLARYGSPVPPCDKVLSIDECQQYSPWARDYLYAATYPKPSLQGLVVYPFVWFHRMVYETMFTITSYMYEPTRTVTYAAYPPLTIANWTAWIIVIAGLAAIVRFWRRIWDNYGLRVLLMISLFYVAVLFLENFGSYRKTGEVVAVHGRYLVPLFPILLVAMIIGMQQAMLRYRLRAFQPLLLTVALLCFMQGGGITNWIITSTPAWYWQQQTPAARANWLAKDVLKYVIIK